MRNLGGALALAIINTNIIDNTKRFSGYLGENLRITDPNVVYSLEYIKSLLDGKVFDDNLAALSLVGNLLKRDALIITINNIFAYMSVIFLFSIILTYMVETTDEKTTQHETKKS